MTTATRSDPGLWMGILALAGMLCLSVVAVSFVFMARDRGAVTALGGESGPAPVIVNNVLPGTQAAPPASGVERKLAGKPHPGATRAPADSHYVNAIPGKLATPTAVAGSRHVAVHRRDASPPPYERPSRMAGYAPLPEGNAASPGSGFPAQPDGAAPAFQPRFAIPDKVPGETPFSSAQDQELGSGTIREGDLRVTITRLRRSSQALPPYGYRPLKGHEFLVADMEIANMGNRELQLDETSVWAWEASDPDTGYYQNAQLLGEVFPKTLLPGETLVLTSSIVFLTQAPPAGLVVEAAGEPPVQISLQTR